MIIVTTGDHDETGTIEVDVTLETMIGVPSDLTVAADGGDEPIMGSSVRLGVVESVCCCHPRRLLVVRWPSGSVDTSLAAPPAPLSGVRRHMQR